VKLHLIPLGMRCKWIHQGVNDAKKETDGHYEGRTESMLDMKGASLEAN